MVLWLFGFGSLINDAANKDGISDEKNYMCEKSPDCAEKSICGGDVCINRNYEPMCIVPESPLIKAVRNKILSLIDSLNPSYVCVCSNKKCITQDKSNITIEEVWNNNGKISLTIYSGIDDFKGEDIEVIDAIIGMQVQNRVNCASDLNVRSGSLCQIDTILDFPKKPGKDGAVKIGISSYPKYYAYYCGIFSIGETTCSDFRKY